MNNEQKSSSIFWLIRQIQPFGLAVLGTFLALCLAAGSVLFIGQGLRVLIDDGFIAQNPKVLDQALMLLLGLVLIIALASFARSFLSSWLGEKVAAGIRQQAFKKLLTLPTSFYLKQTPGQVHSRLHTDTNLIQVLLGGAASTGLRSVIQFIGAMTFLVYNHPKLAGMSCLIIPIILLPIFIFGKKVRQQTRQVQTSEAEAANFSLESLEAIKTIQAYNQEKRIEGAFNTSLSETLKQSYQRIITQSLLSTMVIFLVFGAVSVLLWYGGHEVLKGNMTSGEMLSFIFYAVLAAGSINSLSVVYGDWQRAVGACGDLQEIMNQVSSEEKESRNLPEGAVGQISFEEIDFSYPGQKGHLALNRFNLSIKRGETVAIVGPSGAGKSTLFNLLLRFYQPEQGRILLDGRDISELNPEFLRSKIGWVPQNPAIFNDSVLNNIKFAKPKASEEEVIEAAKAAYSMDFISKLSKGLDTNLGDKGVTLSTGQRQRIAIARAILVDPAILLLDEATNSLDSESEFQIQKALDRLMKGRTTLIVAHRLSTVLKANRIVVMDQGQAVSSGSHTSLLRNSPIYRRFVSLQFNQEEKDDNIVLQAS